MSTRCDNGEGCDVGGDCATRFCRDDDCAFAPAETGVGPGGCTDDVDNDGDGRLDRVDTSTVCRRRPVGCPPRHWRRGA